MTRYEYEVAEATKRGKTVEELGAAGYVSARCECGREDCPGWQMVAIPADAPEFERRAALVAIGHLKPQPFGGAQPSGCA